MDNALVIRAIKHIDAFRRFKSSRLLDTCYGPQSKPLRGAVAAVLLDRKVTCSDKIVQWGNFRKLLLEAVGATGECIAGEDHDFEEKAAALLNRTEQVGRPAGWYEISK